MPDLTRFAGYPSPESLLADPWLGRDDKISGLRTWRGMILKLGTKDDERDLLSEIERALEYLAEGRA